MGKKTSKKPTVLFLPMGFVEEARSEADQTNDLSLRSSIAGCESRMLKGRYWSRIFFFRFP